MGGAHDGRGGSKQPRFFFFLSTKFRYALTERQCPCDMVLMDSGTYPTTTRVQGCNAGQGRRVWNFGGMRDQCGTVFTLCHVRISCRPRMLYAVRIFYVTVSILQQLEHQMYKNTLMNI